MKTIKAGFQGVPGSFSEEALLVYYSNNNIEAVALPEFEDICTSVESGTIDYGILPIENSSTGAITHVYDLLNQYNVFIRGEVCLSINQHLLTLPETEIDDIKEVYSHPQGFEQSRAFLKEYPWSLIPYYNTAKSAELVSKCKRKEKAAIGSQRAAELYGLKVLRRCINSSKTNSTRFVIIGKDIRITEDCNKISIVMATKHTAGSLFNVLRYFAENGINMLKIESRPIPDRPWEYFFYVDFEGNLSNNIVGLAMERIKESTEYFKLLGNYRGFTSTPSI
jgi:chorismate mutase/prephenate dehydratase